MGEAGRSRPEVGRLEAWFSQASGALVAFSGGVDSSLVAFLGRRFLGRDRCRAVISASPSLKMSELENARTFARRHDIPLEVIVTGEIDNPDYFNNPANRCYFCKDALYSDLEAQRRKHPDWWVLNGSNADDAGDYRPGLQAALEYAVRSPLAECRVDKAGVRAVAAHFELECWDKPASPCLASRIPYGERVTGEKLRQIEAGEEWLAARGFPVSRVRHFGDFARIEVPADRIAALRSAIDELAGSFAGFGFPRVEIDPEGLVSGKLNRVLAQAK